MMVQVYKWLPKLKSIAVGPKLVAMVGDQAFLGFGEDQLQSVIITASRRVVV